MEIPMYTKKQKIRSEIIVLAIVAIIIAFAFFANWWKTHSAVGWSIVAVLIAAFGFSLYKYPPFRDLITRNIKQTSKKIIFEDVASSREPLPNGVRSEVIKRSNHRCENPDCRNAFIHIHHVDMNNSNNKLTNLIALCPNCHAKAHDGIFTTTQQRNWLWADYRLRTNRLNS